MSPISRLACVVLACAAHAAHAEDALYSVFGTLGYARSNSAYRYQRFIDNDGTLSRDSRFGAQLDMALGPELRATVQARLAPAGDNDEEWNLRLPWAFLSWRPDNDFVVRAGKMRLPVLLYAENIDVGTTFPFARLPIEAYSILPVWSFYGVSVGRSWAPGTLDVELEGFGGWAHGAWRVYLRDRPEPAGTGMGHGPWFEGIAGGFVSAVLTVRHRESRYQFGAQAWNAHLDTLRFPTAYPQVQLAPGVAYYQTADALPGPGVPTVAHTRIYIATAGVEQALPAGFRLVGEVALRRTEQINVAAGADSFGGYLALLRPVGAWTPYVYSAGVRSSSRARRLYETLGNSHVPDGFPQADVLNASQRGAADSAVVFDQRSWALGTSYALDRGQVVKTEWQRTHVGLTSAFLDVPAGMRSGGHQVDVLSVSYSFSF